MGAFNSGGSSLGGKRIVVLGAAGFIGSHLCEAIQEGKPERLYMIDNLSLGKKSNLDGIGKGRAEFIECDAAGTEIESVIRRIGYADAVFNLAVSPLEHSLEQPWHNFDWNTRIVNNVCVLQKAGLFKTLIHFSSSEAYGSAQYEPMDEKHPLGPSTPYAAAKAAGDLLALSYARTFGLQTTILRPFNCYGPRQNDKSYAGVIPITINRILKGKNPVLHGDGAQTRDYSYVTDTAQAALQLYMNINRTGGKIVNMGSGRQTAIIVLVMLIVQIMKEMGYEDRSIDKAPVRIGDVRRHIANVYQAEDLLGYNPSMAEPLSSGLRKTIRWYIEKKGGKKG